MCKNFTLQSPKQIFYPITKIYLENMTESMDSTQALLILNVFIKQKLLEYL